MKLPDKLPSNMQEAKSMFKDLYDQVVVKVSEVCNKVGKHGDAAEKKPDVVKAAEKPVEENKPDVVTPVDDNNPDSEKK